jgi:hypothetical protein
MRESFQVEWIQDGFSAFIEGFVRLFFVSVIVWMVGLIVLLFREMFHSGEFVVKEYMYKVWKMLLSCLEWVAYAGVFVSPIMMMFTKKYLIYSMVTIDAILLSILYLTIRKRTGGFTKSPLRMSKEKGHEHNWH